MRKLIYFVATTLDGFIAHTDHSINGFLNEGDHASEYIESLKNDFDTVIMGRKTYDFGLQYGVTNPYPWLHQFVFSSSLQVSPDANVQLVSSNPIEFVEALKLESGKSIYLCGGATFASALMTANLIDEIMVKLNPVVFGTGIGLVPAIPNFVALNLQSAKVYQNGVLLLRYTIK